MEDETEESCKEVDNKSWKQ